MGLFNFWKSKTKQAVIEGALEAVEALEAVDSAAAESAAQSALAGLGERVRVIGGRPVVQINVVNVGGTVSLPAGGESPALPAGKVTVVEADEPAPSEKAPGKKSKK